MPVSTADRDLEVQRRRLREEAKAISHLPGRRLRKELERPGLATLIDYARPGDIVCVVPLDRLGRSLKELLETVDGFKQCGIEFRSIEERLDTSSAAGGLVFRRSGAIAHFERRRSSSDQGRNRRGPVARQTPGRPPLAEQVEGGVALIDAGMRRPRWLVNSASGGLPFIQELTSRVSEVVG